MSYNLRWPFKDRRGIGHVRSVISKVRIYFLKAQVEASRLYSIELAQRFENAATSAERTMLARQFDKSLKQTHATQLLLELLERK